MAKGQNKILKKRLVNAYISSVISISLVLLLVGVASMLLVNARAVSDYFKENMQVSVLMKQEVASEATLKFKSTLDTQPYVRSSKLVSKEQGRREMAQLLGEDFLEVFESSPIPESIDIMLNAKYVSSDSLEVVKNDIMKSPLVDEVIYQRSLIDALNENLSKISAVLAVFIMLMVFISFVLINNTVRLSVFAKRFTIHTMKLVGATRSFIRAPFLVQAVFQGIFASFIAIAILIGLLFVVRSEFAQLFIVFRMQSLLLVMGIVFASGVVLCVASTYFVVNKLVSLRREELYY